MEQQEYIMKIGMIQQEAQQMEQRIQVVDQQLAELEAVKESLVALSGNKKKDKQKNEKKEILANIGKGIFAKAEIIDDKLLVNVGAGIIVKKSAEETAGIVEEQLGKLIEGKSQMISRIQELQEEMNTLLEEARAKLGRGEGGEGCGEDCECEEDCGDKCKCKHEH